MKDVLIKGKQGRVHGTLAGISKDRAEAKKRAKDERARLTRKTCASATSRDDKALILTSFLSASRGWNASHLTTQEAYLNNVILVAEAYGGKLQREVESRIREIAETDPFLGKEEGE